MATQKHFRKKNTSQDGTVFGIVSRAIRPRRCGCHGDYLRVCRQRRVEFGTSLALLVIVSVVVVLALCALGNLISSFVSFVSLSLVISRKLTAAFSSSFSFLQSGETIAEAGKEALKTIGVLKTPI